jgi:hypothetical protein
LWQAVKADPVLAAAVRGILSGLLRDKAGTRDEVFWTYRINTVRAVLTAAAPATTEPRAAQQRAPRQVGSATTEAPEVVVVTPPRAVAPAATNPSVPVIPFQAPLY